jgi:transcriptional antiterminator NusG
VPTDSDSYGFFEGQEVQVVEGPFVGFTGPVTRVNPRTHRLTILITIYGRQTTVDLAFDEVQKL